MSDILTTVFEAISQLNEAQLNKLKTHLKELEDDKAFEELSALQARCAATNAKECPHCLSNVTIGWGSNNGRPRYKCNNCNRTFNPLTGTAWHYIHKHDKLKAYIRCMVQGKSIRACAKAVGICQQTSFAWRHKLLGAVEKTLKNQLKEHIQADETFFLHSCKGSKEMVSQQQRKPRKRGGKSTKRGISKELVCVVTALDKRQNMVLKVAGFGRLTKQMVQDTLSPKIRKQRKNRATLVTDKHQSYKQLVEQKKLIHQTVCAQQKQYVNEAGYHINSVNALHSRLKGWIGRFNGVATKYLQHYMNYFRLWDKRSHFKEQLMLFFNQSVLDNQVFVTYADIGKTTSF